jgi:genome maintenance exonuclease 1
VAKLVLPRYTFERDDNRPDGRHYYVPEAKSWIRSVTNTIGATSDNSGLISWREWKGDEEADKINFIARARGNRLHYNIEQYLLNGVLPEFSFLHTPYWNSIWPYLQTITGVALAEGAVYHPEGVVGSLDFLGYHDCDPPDFLAMDDWKSADRPIDVTKKAGEIKLYNYKLQLAAYIAGVNYTYREFNINVRKANLLIAIPDEEYQKFVLEEEELRQLFFHFKARYCQLPKNG